MEGLYLLSGLGAPGDSPVRETLDKRLTMDGGLMWRFCPRSLYQNFSKFVLIHFITISVVGADVQMFAVV